MKLILILSALLSVQLSAARNINIDVEAQWPRHSTSFVLELSEFLSDQSPASYWSYVDKMCLNTAKVDDVLSISSAQSNENDAAKLHDLDSFAFATASEIVSTSMHSLMRTMVRFCVGIIAICRLECHVLMLWFKNKIFLSKSIGEAKHSARRE
jgi:hypothetical protein